MQCGHLPSKTGPAENDWRVSPMSEPLRPPQETIEQGSSGAPSDAPAADASTIKGEPAKTAPLKTRTAFTPQPRPPALAETISTLAGEPGPEPGEFPGPAIDESGVPSTAGGSESFTFQLAPPVAPGASSDVEAGEMPPLLSDVAGYKILKVLGLGGMGVVYKARQRGLKRIVALKMIRSPGHHGPAELARFRSEAMAVADLQHPNIVQIYEVGEDQGHPFFSLEYVSGGSLANVISGTPRPPREAALLLQLLANAMDYAHLRGIIHRDLKPANVLLTEAGEPKVSDFGLVKRLEDDAGQTQSGSILGTPSYMAPEQAEGKNKEIGPRSDLYALGGILYEMMTGRPPFRAASVLDTLQQVRTQEPIAPSQFQPKVPRDLETICLKCLQKDPAKRYATAAALGEDLRRFLAGESILARPVSRAESFWRWCRRNPRVASLSGSVAALFVVWAVTSTLLYRRALSGEQAARANAATASQNAALAQQNAEDARSKAQEALTSAATARQNAERASANEARARKQEQAAKAIAQDSIIQMIQLGEQVMRRLRAKHDPARAEAEWLRLRDDVLTILQKEMVPLAERIEAQGVSPFAFATLHQRLGDLLRKLGQVEDARREYQQGYDRIARVAQDQPDNDVARANLGVMLVRLGEMALDQSGDAVRARYEFDRAWNIQEEISLHPRSGNYSKPDNDRILSGIAIKQGTAELALGHAALACERFQKALELRHAWTKAQPRNAQAHSYTSEAALWLGVAYSHLGDWKGARPHFDEALQICSALAGQHPEHMPFRADLASVYGEQGAALARSGQQDEAEKALNQSLNYARDVLARDPEDVTQRLVTAGASEQLAALAVKRGKPAEAERLWRVALEIRTELAQLEPYNVPAQAALALALAHSGRRAEASKRAEDLLKTNAARTPILLPLARCFAVCAAGAPSDADRRSATTLAREALAAALRNGYRDPAPIRTDPDFAQLLSDPGFKTLVDGLR
jgi:eukaryotic-like serine/threonine-protein kinase